MSDIDLAVGNDDDMVNCPYDIGHRMLRKRLQQHLLKCRLNNPDVELIKCPFNQLHLVAEPEYEIHIRYCTDRKLITQYKQQASSINEDISHAPIDCEGENWDDDDTEDNNPQSYDQKPNVLIQTEIPYSRSQIKLERDNVEETDVAVAHLAFVKREPKEEVFKQEIEDDEPSDCKTNVMSRMHSGRSLNTDVRQTGNVASCSGRDSRDYRYNSGDRHEKRKIKGYSNDGDEIKSRSSWKHRNSSYNAPYVKEDLRRRRN